MKYDRQKAFPYPVLRPENDDYKDCAFQATVEFTVGKDNIKVNITYALSSNEILNEIEKGSATFTSIIACRDTYYRSVLSSRDKECESTFDIHQLRGEVKVDPYVFVKKNILEFKSADINPEFGSGPFKFFVGDVMAQDEPQIFYIDRDLFKPITSVFDLVKKDDLTDGEWTIGFEEDHVHIEVGPAMKKAIDDARNTHSNRVVLLNSLYFAAVMQAVQKLKEAPLYREKKWGEIICRQAHNKGYDLMSNDAYILTERLLQYPLRLLEKHIFKGKES